MAQTEIATLGGGCFWCLEAVYQRTQGVTKVVSGYTGGHQPSPTYREVCNGETGHAEVVQVYFDPETITYWDVLDLFWRCHDPTTLNRQGADIGTQYRSAIYVHDPDQRKQAEESKRAAQALYKDAIVTEITDLGEFFVAEDYHQNYYNDNPNVPYCTFVIRPKLDKLGMT